MDDARHVRAVTELHGQHRPPAALGHERLLEVVSKLGRSSQPRQLVGDALAPGAELAAQPAQERRGVVAEAGAVFLHATVDLCGDGGELRLDGPEQRGEERRRLLLLGERAPRGQRRRDRGRDLSQVARLERPAALGAVGGDADVRNAAQGRRGVLLEERHGLGRPSLARGDLGGLGRGNELACEIRPRRRRGSGDEPLDDERILEHFEGPAVHPTSLP